MSYNYTTCRTSKLFARFSIHDGVTDPAIPAVDVQQNARPATADEPMVPNTPARGKDMRAPILVGYGRFSQERGGGGVRVCKVVGVSNQK